MQAVKVLASLNDSRPFGNSFAVVTILTENPNRNRWLFMSRAGMDILLSRGILSGHEIERTYDLRL